MNRINVLWVGLLVGCGDAMRPPDIGTTGFETDYTTGDEVEETSSSTSEAMSSSTTEGTGETTGTDLNPIMCHNIEDLGTKSFIKKGVIVPEVDGDDFPKKGTDVSVAWKPLVKSIVRAKTGGFTPLVQQYRWYSCNSLEFEKNSIQMNASCSYLTIYPGEDDQMVFNLESESSWPDYQEYSLKGYNMLCNPFEIPVEETGFWEGKLTLQENFFPCRAKDVLLKFDSPGIFGVEVKSLNLVPQKVTWKTDFGSCGLILPGDASGGGESGRTLVIDDEDELALAILDDFFQIDGDEVLNFTVKRLSCDDIEDVLEFSEEQLVWNGADPEKPIQIVEYEIDDFIYPGCAGRYGLIYTFIPPVDALYTFNSHPDDDTVIGIDEKRNFCWEEFQDCTVDSCGLGGVWDEKGCAPPEHFDNTGTLKKVLYGGKEYTLKISNYYPEKTSGFLAIQGVPHL